MTKTFCDQCKREISAYGPALSFESKEVKVQYSMFKIVASGSDHQESDICFHCVLDAIAKLDDRPRMAGN